jgi:hypothetical protein
MYYMDMITEDPRRFSVPFKLFFFFFVDIYFFFKKYLSFFSHSSEINYNKDKIKPAYIRDCYYRIISEILLADFSKYENIYKLVVVGSPGIGKSCLSFLFIRVLLELGVEACFFLVLFLMLF